MKLFGWKSARDAARPTLTRSSFGIALGEWPVSFEAQAREAWGSNPVAQRAVRIVAEGCGHVPLTPSGDEGERAAALVRSVANGQGLVEAMAAQLLLHGNAYVLVSPDAAGLPAELFALRPERVTIEYDARGWPAAYAYRAGDQVSRWPAWDAQGRPGVIHVRALNPLDDHYGQGCLGAAAGAVAIHNAATRWNKALLDNAARPSGALVYDPGEPGATLSADQFTRLKAEMDASFSGAPNAGRPMLLEGGLKWQAMSLSPADMDFVGLKANAAREIALAFGVPPMLLGLPGDNTYANYAEANRALWRQTIVPLTTKIVDALVEGLRGWWPEVALALDLDALPALAADRAALWAQVTAADFLSPEEKRAMVGLENPPRNGEVAAHKADGGWPPRAVRCGIAPSTAFGGPPPRAGEDFIMHIDMLARLIAQAQKELFHNEALALLDGFVLPVFAPPQDDPPTTPAIGTGWIVGAIPSGDWSGHAGALTLWTTGGWRFAAPGDGMQVALADGRMMRREAGVWTVGQLVADALLIEGAQVVGAQRPAIADPSGGATIDAGARATLAAMLAALRDHGLIAT